MFNPSTFTRIESGSPLAMHKMIGEPIVGEHFRADMREFSWNEPVVSTGWTDDSAQILFFPDRRRCKPQSAYAEEGKFTVEPTHLGDIILIPPKHALVSHCPPWRQRVVFFSFDPHLLPEFSDIEWSTDLLMRTLDIRNPKVHALMGKIADEMLNPDFASDLVVEGVSLQLIVELHRTFGQRKDDGERRQFQLSSRQLEMITDCIMQDHTTPTLADLATLLQLSPRHFTRLFKNTTGMTVGQFVSETRMTLAKNLLVENKLLIKEVAYRCGFRNTPAFAAAFRRATGYAPRDFRLTAGVAAQCSFVA